MDNPFKKILAEGINALKGGGSHESVLGVDIGTSSIKVVQLKRKGGKAVLETYGALALGPYATQDVGSVTNLSMEKLSQALIDVIRESGTTTKDASLSIPSSASLIFMIDLPPTINEAQFSSIIPTEARKYIPVPVSEVSLDYWVIPKKDDEVLNDESNPNKQDKTEVLVAAIHNETISKYKDLVSKSNIHSDFFEIEIFSAIRSTFAHELSPVLILDFGASKSKVSIVEYGIVRNFHIINRGSQDITNALSKSLSIPFSKAEEMKREFGLYGSSLDKNVADITRLTVDFILNEVNNVLLSYERKFGKTVSKVVLTGGGVMLKGFFEAARTNFSCDVELGDPFSKIESPAFLENVLKTTGPEFAIAIGLALRHLKQE
jgi:type IV pilus assembly protein PilM